MTQPASANSPRTEDLIAVLEHGLSRHSGGNRRIVALHRRASPFQSSYALEELTVAFADGARLELLFKDLSPDALTVAARIAKPFFLFDPAREVLTYEQILAPGVAGTARCYLAVADASSGRYWLGLEKLAGRELYQIGEFDVWLKVARWLAVLHSAFSGFAGLGELAASAHLLRYRPADFRRWLERARSFARAGFSTAALSQTLEALARRYDQVIEFLTALPVTFLHGEFYASNVIVQTTEARLRICPVDWELAAVGPGLIDLAALVAGKWTEPQKTSLALAYRAALTGSAAEALAEDTFLKALDFCRLHLAVQWLGWSDSWAPPAEHAQDWSAEVRSVAERLGLLL
jgi:hypothetical protein